MPEARSEVIFFDDFLVPVSAYGSSPLGAGGFILHDTSSAGAPIAATHSSPSGEVALTLAADSEAEVLCLYHGDILPFSLLQLKEVEFIAKVSGINSVTTLTMGLGSARNTTDDSVATNVWFRMQGSASTSNVVVETDDGTTDNDDKATGQTLSSTYKRFAINFENGVSDIRFFMEDSSGNLVRVASSTTFSMSAATATTYVQPIIQLQKASGTGTPSVTLDYFKVNGQRIS